MLLSVLFTIDSCFEAWEGVMKKIWPFTVNAFLFGGFAFVAPFIVLYYQELGFSGAQIGMLTGITPLVTFLSAPLWTRLADATRKHRLVMSIALLIGGITIGLFPFVRQFIPLFVLVLAFNGFFAPVSSFNDNATMFMLGDEKEMYGRVRLGGTIAFGLTPPLAGVMVGKYGLGAAFWGCAIMFLLALIVSQKLVHREKGVEEAGGEGILSLIWTPRWLVFLGLAFAGGIASTGVNYYLFPYLKELGASETTMGLALTIGMIAEIPAMVFGNLLIRRFQAYGLLMLAMVLTGVRMLLFATTGSYILALVIQLLNGLTFPAMWLAGVSYADELAPSGLSATAQGLFAAMVFGIGAAAGGFICGPLLESLGGRGLFLVLGIVVLVIVGIAGGVQRRLGGGEVQG